VPLEALNHRRDIGTGDTRPQLFLCDNDGRHEFWVLKLMGLANAELAADWIGSLLAHRLGVPCPEVAIASVTTEALATAPEAVRGWARPGPAFASALVEPAVSGLTDPDLVEFPTEVLGAMYALDVWLEVLDRRKPDGVWNVLEDKRDGSLVVLDFGKSLTPCFEYVIGGDDDPILPPYPPLVRRAASLPAALETCASIETLDDNDIEETVASVPIAWLEVGIRERINRFLRRRAGLVRGLCERGLGGEGT
jgi:hypothetical protein